MGQAIIEVQDLGKRYRIGGQRQRYLSLREELSKALSVKHRRELAAKNDFWALREVSFSVNEGQAVGIIGRNGAGKSTLLKVLSRITPPTEGRIHMHGRVASLLEVGTGFHPELSGRENIYLNGAILGMGRKEITRKFGEIVEFAEIERFLDTPVKRYSSGMYVRLAFAVAAHLEPEILVIDEVLAVGDAEFQRKCLGKMGDVASSGRTVLFVSHNMGAIANLCGSCIVLDHGEVLFSGKTADAVATYLKHAVPPKGECYRKPARSTGPAHFTKVEVVDSDGSPKDSFHIGESLSLQFDLHFPTSEPASNIGFIVRPASGQNVYHCVTADASFQMAHLQGDVSVRATFPHLALYPGTYVIAELAVSSATGEVFDDIRECASFEVLEGGPCVLRRLAPHAAVVHETPRWEFA